MTPWTTNQDWHQPIKRDPKVCGRISDRFISCSYPRPCPIHDSPHKGAGGISPSLSVPPAPRFFDEPTNQHRALAMHNRKEGP